MHKQKLPLSYYSQFSTELLSVRDSVTRSNHQETVLVLQTKNAQMLTCSTSDLSGLSISLELNR